MTARLAMLLTLASTVAMTACGDVAPPSDKPTSPVTKSVLGEWVIIDPKIADFPKVLLWCEGTTLFALSRVDGSDWDDNAAGGGGVAVAVNGCPNGEVPGR